MTTETTTPHTKPRRLGGANRTVSTRLDATEPEAPARPPSVAAPNSPGANRRPPQGPSSRETRRQKPPATVARYDQLERKETRLREDQVDELNRLARNLAKQARRRRAPGDKAERITDNTLIRVAVDLLLAQSERLTGTTETELRDSVGPRA